MEDSNTFVFGIIQFILFVLTLAQIQSLVIIICAIITLAINIAIKWKQIKKIFKSDEDTEGK